MESGNTLLKESTVYAFNVPSINAIKVGFGSDGTVRMHSYSRQYGLVPDESSLREWKLPASSIASTIETACHRALLEAGFYRVSRVVDDREAKELFDLGDYSYENALLMVTESIDAAVNTLHEALGSLTPLSDEKSRQKNEAALKRREARQLEQDERNRAIESREISIASEAIRSYWDTHFDPYIVACNKANKVWKQFDIRQNFVSSLWKGKLSTAARILEWKKWDEVNDSIPTIFKTGRKAKQAYCELNRTHGKYVNKAAEEMGVSVWSPGGNYLPFVDGYNDDRGQAFLEVRLVVQMATGFGGDDAAEIIDSNIEVKSIVEYAEKKLPPELAKNGYA